MKKIVNILSTVIVVLVVLLAVLLVGIRLAGFQVYSVLSGSMEPNIHTGSIIYVRAVDPQTLQPGDPITFMLNETTVVTHRITRIETDAVEADTLWFYTQGDANSTEDAKPVHYKNVLGKAEFSIPLLGYVASYVQKPPGLYVAIGVGVVLLVVCLLPDGKKKKDAGDGSQCPTDGIEGS